MSHSKTNVNTEMIDALVALAPGMTDEQVDLARAVYEMLAGGEPVPLDHLATRANRSVDAVRGTLGEMPGVFRDDEDRIVGFLGLTIEKTSHQIDVLGRTLYAWCALDTLFLPRVLGAPARVRSTSPNSDRPIELEVTPDGARLTDGTTLVMSIVRPDPEQFRTNVLSSFCHHIYFFRSTNDAEAWQGDRSDVELLNLDDAYELGRRLIERLLRSRGTPTPAA